MLRSYKRFDCSVLKAADVRGFKPLPRWDSEEKHTIYPQGLPLETTQFGNSRSFQLYQHQPMARHRHAQPVRTELFDLWRLQFRPLPHFVNFRLRGIPRPS